MRGKIAVEFKEQTGRLCTQTEVSLRSPHVPLSLSAPAVFFQCFLLLDNSCQVIHKVVYNYSHTAQSLFPKIGGGE